MSTRDCLFVAGIGMGAIGVMLWHSAEFRPGAVGKLAMPSLVLSVLLLGLAGSGDAGCGGVSG